MKNINNKKIEYKELFKNKSYVISFVISFLLLGLSVMINYYAGTYATERASMPVTDIILSNIRVFDVDVFFAIGPMILLILITLICFYKPNKLPFIVKSVALFVIIRSIFITLTHIGPFPTEALLYNGANFMNKFTFGGDLFFSGHTGIPFLLSLIFWHNKIFRYVFLFFSIFMGTVVLLGHYHYTIDVLAAFFITYSIFHLSSYIFKKDKEIFYGLNKN